MSFLIWHRFVLSHPVSDWRTPLHIIKRQPQREALSPHFHTPQCIVLCCRVQQVMHLCSTVTFTRQAKSCSDRLVVQRSERATGETSKTWRIWRTSDFSPTISLTSISLWKKNKQTPKTSKYVINFEHIIHNYIFFPFPKLSKVKKEKRQNLHCAKYTPSTSYCRTSIISWDVSWIHDTFMRI